MFYLEQSTAGFQQFTFGGPQDIIIPGDFDGDQTTDLATVRGVTGGLSWQARLSGTGGTWPTTGGWCRNSTSG